MESGSVVEIFIGPEFTRPVMSVESVKAVAGRGLEGDRYYHRNEGPNSHPDEEITLIESEAIAAAQAETDVVFGPEDTRRNIVTSGVRLDDLVGRTLTVGEVRVEAIELNPACAYLVKITKKPFLKQLIHRGGIRGRILSSGVIRRGDAIRID
ncbi:MAG: MOSC domain-containing protein [Actinomycetota bacterium]|nr:MOSC domain-containing protein [Actinomycetota bacterium]